MALYSNPQPRSTSPTCCQSPLIFLMAQDRVAHFPPSIFNIMIEPLAEALHSDSSISGFSFGSCPHKINLFADNVILILTDLSTSLSCAHTILERFSQLSYYKVNFTKLLILVLGISPTLKHAPIYLE